MEFNYHSPHGDNKEWEQILYGKNQKEPMGSRILYHLGIISSGIFLGSLITDNLYLGLGSLGLAWGSVGVRHLLYRRRKVSPQELQ